MSMLDEFTGFNFAPIASIYDDNNKNYYDDTFAESPPTTETFIILAQKLGYTESEHIAMMRRLCIDTDYARTENIPQAQGIATFEKLCAETAAQYRDTPDRLTVTRGLRLSEASVYFHFEDYSQCIHELRVIHEDISHESYSETESNMEVAALMRYVAKRQIGHKVVADTTEIAS